MTTNEMKKVLADKLEAEGTGFTFKDISITKAKMLQSTEWDEEKDAWKYESVDAYKVVIKDFEHIHFFITCDTSDYFGNEVWVWEKYYCRQSDIYEGSNIIADAYSKVASHEEIIKEVLVRLGYIIGNTF